MMKKGLVMEGGAWNVHRRSHRRDDGASDNI